MDISTNALSERATSSYPLSIGTALAIESFGLGPNKPYDESRVIPQHINVSKYDYFYVNVLTLFRNIVGAVSAASVDGLLPGDISIVMDQEANIISEIVYRLSGGKTKTVFYCSEYKDMKRTYPNANLRGIRTAKQVLYHALMQSAVKDFLQNVSSINTVFFDRDIKPESSKNALILTHYAYDLLSSNQFNQLHLIESHTGVLKKPAMFYTKLLDGKNLVRIPFNKMSIQVFGDKETFSPMAMSVKKEVLALSEKYKWTQVTSRDRLYYSFNQIKDSELSNLLKSLI